MLDDSLFPQTRSRPSRTSDDLHQLLREATARDHRRLEAALNLQDAELSLPRYRRVLAALHGFYAPLEARVRSFGPVTPPPGFVLPDRARLLALDLAALGAAPAVAACEDLPPIATTADLAGCLYVLEGAALGGQVLARSVAERWGLSPRSGAGFFYGDGPRETKHRWKLVLAWLERVARSGVPASAAVEAARGTFVALERWSVAAAAATR